MGLNLLMIELIINIPINRENDRLALRAVDL